MEQLFYPHLLAWFFWGTIVIWQIIAVWRGINHEPGERTKAGKQNDLITLFIPGIAAVSAVLLKAVFPATDIYSSSTFFWIGLAITWVGIVLRETAIQTLGKFFVMTIITQADQPVITHGVYRYIRHPSYLGGIVTVAGIGLALNSLPGLFVIIIPTTVVVVIRIKAEDKYLAKALGKPYQTYMQHTHRLLPFIW